jgi:acyl transferase domain-containing protein
VKLSEDIDLHGVAIIGMSGRFPGADSIDEYWKNISQGLDCTRDLTIEEVIESGVEPEIANSDSYIRRCADLNDIDQFDAAFFDYLPNEAKILDPQARLFLECVQTALDDAGCDPDRFDGSIGVYAGTGLNNYLLKNIMRNPGLFEDLLDFQTIISNDKDFLSTQVNYKFNLTGPGISVQTACSTSLVAIQLAYQSLLTYQCDVAVSGGTHIRSPRARGNPYKEGEIFSPDGYCRPFDKDASGTIFGEGAGVVVLKRLEDALADRDHIYGVIRGAAINNDGKQKVSYAAPSVKGQAEVVAMAQTLAGLDADEIGYVEAHGTGTKLGDPIEIRALTQAFRLSTDKKNYCAIGSGKSMIGHLDVAAGVAGFIRASLALHHKTIPPTAHFVSPNPELKLDESPFYICSEATPWEGGTNSRIAAVSSFGVGGTNAHAIIQEAPAYSNSETKKNSHLLVLSAKTPSALDAQAKQLAAFFEKVPDTSIADAAYTLQMGRRQFPHRKVVVCDSTEQAVERLTSSSQTFTSKGVAKQNNKPVMFMFSGQGSQYINMCRDLYSSEIVFAECINTCAEAVTDIVGFNFVDVIFSDQEDEAGSQQVKQTNLAQPALYAIECGLARLWSHYGINVQAMIGHSIGEFAAAYVAGVFSLEEGARIVATRGKLMQQMQPGAMLGLRNAAEDVDSVLEDRDLAIVVINGPELTVVGGPVDNINEFKAELEAENISASLLHTSHAFHSRMMDDAVAPFVAEVSKYSLQEPTIPFISNVTGEWITPEQAVDPGYWGNQMRSPVQFSKGIENLCMGKNPVLLEVGPGQALSILCQQQAEHVKKCSVVSSVRHPQQDIDDVTCFYRAYGALWANGASVDLSTFYDEERRKVSLPSYPFERKSFWISSSLTGNLHAVSSEVVANDSNEESPCPNASRDIAAAQDKSIEGIVTGVWEELLGCDDIQPSDNFFNLGGHSLVASQMLEKVEANCGRKVTLTMLNNSDTLGDFCAAIEALPGDELLEKTTKQPGKTSLTSTTKEQWSLSPQQERLWFYHEYSNSDPAYNLAQTIVVEGRIDLDTLKEAVDHVLSIHEAFNTVFTYKEDWQVIAKRSEKVVGASIQSLEGDSAEDQENELVKIIIDHNSRVKDFAQETVNAPLFYMYPTFSPTDYRLTFFINRSMRPIETWLRIGISAPTLW